MIGLHVTVPIACFRKGSAREFLETESIPPPATCYGFLLSLIGEADRERHLNARVGPALLDQTSTSVVLRTIWRIKSLPLGASGNTKPDYQQLLTGHSPNLPFINLVIWLDSGNEEAKPTLEDRVQQALKDPASISRFGGLSLGESTHLVDSVSLIDDKLMHKLAGQRYQCFELSKTGRFTLPVWVDHVSSENSVFVTGNLVNKPLEVPKPEVIPRIHLPRPTR